MAYIESPCDKCGEPVPQANDAVEWQCWYSGGRPALLEILMYRSRHMLPTATCEGSPSRVRVMQNEPKGVAAFECMNAWPHHELA